MAFYQMSGISAFGGWTALSGVPNNVRDASFSTFYTIQGSQTGPASFLDSSWGVIFVGGIFVSPSLPNDNRIVTVKARLEVTTTGTAPGRSGSVEFLHGTHVLGGRPAIVWNSTTGDISTGTTDIWFNSVDGVPLTSAYLRSQTPSSFSNVNLRHRLNTLSSTGSATVTVKVYEIWAEDAIDGDVAFAYEPA